MEIMNNPRGVWAFLDRAAALLLVLQTVLMAVIAVGYGVYVLLDGIGSGLGWSLAGTAAVMSVGLGAFAWGWVKRKRFALGGALTWQLMQACVGVWVLSTRPLLGSALLATAALVSIAVMRRHAELTRNESVWEDAA